MSDRSRDENSDESDEFVSKSQRKREAHALQALGEELVRLPANKLGKIPLPEQLLDAIRQAQQIKARGGHKRQLQFIGKLMRSVDAEPIQQALERLQAQAAGTTAAHHHAERWRDRLVEEGDVALSELLSELPQADRQHLRQLIRNAQKEKERNKPPRSARELFRYLRDLQEEQ